MVAWFFQSAAKSPALPERAFQQHKVQIELGRESHTINDALTCTEINGTYAYFLSLVVWSDMTKI